MSSGLLKGLGRGLTMAGALSWEKAKADELARIRAEERQTDRETRAAERVQDREDQIAKEKRAMEAAKELNQYETDQAAGTFEDVYDSDGTTVIGKRNTKTNEISPVNINTGADSRASRAMSMLKMLTQNGLLTRDGMAPEDQESFDAYQAILLESIQQPSAAAPADAAVPVDGSPAPVSNPITDLSPGAQRAAAILGSGQQVPAPSQASAPPAYSSPVRDDEDNGGLLGRVLGFGNNPSGI